VDPSSGDLIERTRSDQQGHFEIALAEGRYYLEPEADGFPGGGERVLVVVPSHGFTRITLHLDTGIR
jgi:hypothetical protein